MSTSPDAEKDSFVENHREVVKFTQKFPTWSFEHLLSYEIGSDGVWKKIDRSV